MLFLNYDIIRSNNIAVRIFADYIYTSPLDLVQRGHNFAIVDEVDSVLIDDARTPLIISGPVPRDEEQFYDEWYDLCKGMCYSIRDVFDDLDSTYILNNDDVSEYVPTLQIEFCGNNLEPNLLL